MYKEEMPTAPCDSAANPAQVPLPKLQLETIDKLEDCSILAREIMRCLNGADDPCKPDNTVSNTREAELTMNVQASRLRGMLEDILRQFCGNDMIEKLLNQN